MSTAFNNTNDSTNQVTEIEYNPKWENGTGYYDHAVKGEYAPVVPFGSIAKPIGCKRPMLIIGTRFGNVVIFKRYSDPSSEVYVFNMPKIVEAMFGSLLSSGRLSEESMIALLGEKFLVDNVGVRIEKMFNYQ